MSHPRPPSLQLLSLDVNGLREKQKRAALFAVLQAGPWHVIALQETHHATQAEAAQWCREGAGPTAPWDGPSFFSFFFLFWVTGELSTLRQMMKVPNEPGLSSNNDLENAFLSDQSMASNPRKGQAKRFGAKTTSHDGKAGHVMTHVCHRVRQEERELTLQVHMQVACNWHSALAG